MTHSKTTTAERAAPSQAMLLAAGLGTRMLPFTRRTPKALTPFLNVPLLEHGLALLARHGVQRVVVNAHHLAEQVVAHVQGRAAMHDDGLEVEVVVEDTLLGTGGGVRGMAQRLDPGPMYLLACDVLAPFDLFALARRHAEAVVEHGAQATMGLVTAADLDRYGAVDVDADGLLCDIVGQRNRPGEWHAVNGSVHVLEHEFVESLPDGPSCLVRDGYLPAMTSGRPCAAYRHQAAWCEVGSPHLLLSAQAAALSGALPIDPTLRALGGRTVTGNMLHPTAKVADDARLLGGTVIGPDAVVEAGAELHGCLVLPGVLITAGERHAHRVLGGDDHSLASRSTRAGLPNARALT